MFIDFLDNTVNLLFNLLDSIDQSENKLQVLSVIGILIQQSDIKIIPHCEIIIQHFKQVWRTSEQNESHNFLKQAIVQSLYKLSQSIFLVENSIHINSFMEFVIPIIHHSTDVNKTDHIYLIEDGLLLWLNVISSIPQLNDNLLSLYSNITNLMDRTFENIKVAMKIIEEYLVLGNILFLKSYASDLISTFLKIIGNVKDDAIIMSLRPIEIFIQLFPKESPQYLDPVLQNIFSLILSGKVL
jgi:hypothetical protein